LIGVVQERPAPEVDCALCISCICSIIECRDIEFDAPVKQPDRIAFYFQAFAEDFTQLDQRLAQRLSGLVLGTVSPEGCAELRARRAARTASREKDQQRKLPSSARQFSSSDELLRRILDWTREPSGGLR
jgi:hypothetical protein